MLLGIPKWVDNLGGWIIVIGKQTQYLGTTLIHNFVN